MEKEEEILSYLKKHNVILSGHFILSSGLRSEEYVQCAKIFENPFLSMKVIENLAEKIRKELPSDAFTSIISPAMGGILCGYELSRQLLCKNIFVERVDNIFTLKRGFEVREGEKFLLVEDVVTTGKSSMEAAKVIEDLGGVIIAAASVIDRRGEEARQNFKFPLISVLKMDIKTYSPDALPEHLHAIQAVKPGSRKQ